MNFLTEIANLQQELMYRTYETSPTSEFIISERGKTRAITGEQMRDRVVRHSLCDEVLTPTLSKYLIYDNGASQKGKGIDFTRRRLVTHLRKFYRKHGNDGYILLIDFSKYYDNIRHDVLIREIEKHITDPECRWLVRKIIDSFKVDVSYMTDEEYACCLEKKFNSLEYRQLDPKFFTGEKFMHKRVDIGDQVSQIAGIFYPVRIDNYVKIVRGQKYYGRYMDDSYLISDSKEELHDILKHVIEIADDLGITVNQKKTRICKISRIFRFLQIGYAVTDSGRVIQKINPKRITAMRRKLKKLGKKVKSGVMDQKDLENTFRSWLGANHKYMSRQQIRNMNALYKEVTE